MTRDARHKTLLCAFVAIKMDWKEELKKFIDDKTVIMGIGSTVRSDDGVGVFIAEKLDSMGFYNVIIAHQTPEHWLGFISKQNYEKVLIIDSVLFGGEKGEIKLFDIGEISKQFGLTHSSPLHLFSDFVSQEGSVKGIKILAVMPENMDIGESLSPVIERSAGEIIGFFKNFK